MIASVHLADVGARRALTMSRKPPSPASVPGLRSARAGVCAPLSASVLPAPQFGRMALIAFWEGDDAIDAFLADHPLAATLATGWHVRLEPLRAYGTWPGLPTDLATERHVAHEGPVAAVTMGRLIPSQAVRFLRTSAKASGSALAAPGLLWGTGIANPPSFFSTVSLWESTKAVSTYAYGNREPAHPDAIASGEAKPFHHEQAFIRFRPYAAQGRLDGKNPLAFQTEPA